MQIASPHLTLGSTVHDTIRWFLEMNGQVTQDQLIAKFRNLWLKYRGKRGGFVSADEEASFGKRGILMLANFFKNAKNLEKQVPQIKFPKYNLTPKVILIGNFDYVGEAGENLHLIDFKTGANDEKDPMQLYIYAILAESNLQKPVSKISFWYLDRADNPSEVVLDDLEEKLEWLTGKAKELEGAIEKKEWVCVKDGQCRDCQDYQAIIDGKGEFMFSDEFFKKDVYFLSRTSL